MKRSFLLRPALALLILWSPFAEAAVEDAVRVLKIDGDMKASSEHQGGHATVTLRVRDLGPEKDVGIVINTEDGETYQPGIYAGIAEYGYEIWKVEMEMAEDQTIEFLGWHRVGDAVYIDDNEGSFYSFTNRIGS